MESAVFHVAKPIQLPLKVRCWRRPKRLVKNPKIIPNQMNPRQFLKRAESLRGKKKEDEVGDGEARVPYACCTEKRCHEKTTDPTRQGKSRGGGEEGKQFVFLRDVIHTARRERAIRRSLKDGSRQSSTLPCAATANTASTQMPKRSGLMVSDAPQAPEPTRRHPPRLFP